MSLIHSLKPKLGDCTLNNPFFCVTGVISMGVNLGLILHEFGYQCKILN
jgi:hypothetical protein